MAHFEFKKEPQDVKTIVTKHRRILTQIPASGTEKILEDLSKFESRSMHGQLPIIWKKAKGSSIYDIADNKWIDFTSGIFVTNVGHANPKVVSSIKQSMDEELISCYAYPNEIRARYYRKLIEFSGSPMEKAFLLSAGSEATEAAFKLMRMYGMKFSTSKKGIICIENNWHGRTLGAQTMSSNVDQKAWIGNLDPDVHHIPFPYPWTIGTQSGDEFFNNGLKLLEKKGVDISKNICGFMIEAFQGWGAVFYPKDFIQSLCDFAERNNILVCFDEMQSGFGRTGKKFGFQNYDVLPDLIACGKGMGGGVPISGVIGKAEILDLPTVGNMSSTHSANPLVCHAGLAVIEELERIMPSLPIKTQIFKSKLNAIKNKIPERVKYVLGEGMIFAVLFQNPKTGEPDSQFASKVCEKCMQKGLLLVHTGRESIKLGPPLTIENDALEEGLDVLIETIGELHNDT